jgi:hypothetical protein
MIDGNLPVKISGLTKPVDTLIKKIASAGWLIYEPLYVKRKARALATASKIRAIGKIEVKNIERRALGSIHNSRDLAPTEYRKDYGRSYRIDAKGCQARWAWG